MASLPISSDNCVVFIHRMADPDPHKYHYDDVFKMFMMMAGKFHVSCIVKCLRFCENRLLMSNKKIYMDI